MSTPVLNNATPTPCGDYASCLAQALALNYQACLQNPPGGDKTKCTNLSPTNPFPSNPPPPAASPDPSNPCSRANGDFQAVAMKSADNVKDFLDKTSTDLANAGKDTLGKNKCTNGQTTAASGFKVPYVNIGTTVNAQFSTGCSQIALQMAVQTSISNSLQCTCTQIKNTSQTSLVAFNTIKITGANIKTAGDFNIGSNQNNQQTAKVINFLSAEVQTQLKQTIQTSLQTVNSALLDQKNSMTPPNAQKSLSLSMAAALNNSANLNMTSIMNEAGLSLSGTNETVLDLSGLTVGGNLNVAITQNNYQTAMIENITKAVMNTIMENTTYTSAVSSNSTTQSQANKGLMSLFGSSTGIGATIVVIIVLIVLGGGLIYYFTQVAGKTRPPASP